MTFWATVTAYCHCALCTPTPPQPCANGAWPIQGITCAAPRSVPFGQRVWVEGVGVLTVQDRMPRRFEGRWDVFLSSHAAAKKFGKRRLRIKLL